MGEDGVGAVAVGVLWGYRVVAGWVWWPLPWQSGQGRLVRAWPMSWWAWMSTRVPLPRHERHMRWMSIGAA